MGIAVISSTKIFDLRLIKLKQIKDDRGAVYHYLKSTDETFKGFGESYYSKINPGIVKGWKIHNRIHQHFCVPSGVVKIVVFDNREDSETKGIIDEIILDDNDNYSLLSMPPKLWYSFKCISHHPSILANIIDRTHDPTESDNIPLVSDEIPYLWK